MLSNNTSGKDVLDLSKGGNLTAEQARLFNYIADEIRQEYVELVNEMSKKYRYDLNWFVTPFACRNTYICSVFEDVVRILFVKDIVCRKNKIDVVIVDTPILAETIKPYLPSHVLINSKQGYTKYYFSLLSAVVTGLVKYIISALLRQTSFKLASSFFGKEVNSAIHSESVSVIETYLYKNSFIKGEFNDRHFCNIKTFLDEEQKNRTLYIPTFYNVYNYFSLYLSAFKAKENFLFVEKFTSLLDIMHSLRHPLSLNYKQSNIKIRNVDISQIVNHSLVRHSTQTSSLYAVLKYRFCENLKKNNSISISCVVRWYENQEIDHGSIMGWRAYSDSLHIVGYMGFFASSNYLCVYPIPVEFNSRMTPDCIGVMGEGLINQHNKFCDLLNIEVVPSFRFSAPINNKRIRKRYTAAIKVLVTLPISNAHINTILKIIAGVSSINNVRPIVFVIKPHPASKNSFAKYLIDRDNVQYFIVDDALTTLFDEVDFVLSVASSSLVEAIMHGVPALIASSTQSLRENVIPEFIPDNLWNEVFSADELYTALTQYKPLGELRLDELKLLNSKIVGLQPNEYNVNHLLGSFN